MLPAYEAMTAGKSEVLKNKSFLHFVLLNYHLWIIMDH